MTIVIGLLVPTRSTAKVRRPQNLKYPIFEARWKALCSDWGLGSNGTEIGVFCIIPRKGSIQAQATRAHRNLGERGKSEMLGPGHWCSSAPKADFLIRLPWLVRADLNGDFPVKPLEKIEELVGGEAVEMAVHQMGHFRLLDP